MSTPIQVGVFNEDGTPVVFIRVGPVIQHLAPHEAQAIGEALAISAQICDAARELVAEEAKNPTLTHEDKVLQVDLSKMN